MSTNKLKTRCISALTIVLSIGLLFVLAMPLSAQGDPLVGTWKLNIEKSTFHFSRAPKSSVHKYEPYGADGIKATAELVDADGKKIHFTYAMNFDGKFYPVIGDPARDMTSLKRSHVYTGVGANMKDGKVINTSRHILSKDGKTLTVTLVSPKGNDIRIYEKQ
jgi:hypothetical protein